MKNTVLNFRHRKPHMYKYTLSLLKQHGFSTDGGIHTIKIFRDQNDNPKKKAYKYAKGLIFKRHFTFLQRFSPVGLAPKNVVCCWTIHNHWYGLNNNIFKDMGLAETTVPCLQILSTVSDLVML